MGVTQNIEAEISREFQVFIKPAGPVCNLECTYCYYLGNSALFGDAAIQRMNDDLLETVIRNHIEAATGDVITFSWHGGEPLLAGIEFYRKAVSIQKKLCPSGKRIINGIQTNGTLINEEWCEFLRGEDFVVGISMDGPGKYHNVFRKGRDGSGTFNKVLNGYDLLVMHGLDPEILCVVNSENSVFPVEIYRFFKHLGVSYLTFIPLVEKNNGTASGSSVSPEAWGDFLCAVFDEWLINDIGKVKIQIIEEALRTAFNQEHTLCIFKPVCGGVPVIEHNGDFYSCDHFVNPEHKLGNIQNSSLSSLLDSDRQEAFGKAKKADLPGKCFSCEVLSMCNGECPKNRFAVTPEGDSGLNYLCRGYRKFFNHCKPFIHAVSRIVTSNE